MMMHHDKLVAENGSAPRVGGRLLRINMCNFVCDEYKSYGPYLLI